MLVAAHLAYTDAACLQVAFVACDGHVVPCREDLQHLKKTKASGRPIVHRKLVHDREYTHISSSP